jgi:hypothetical protein
MQCGHRSSDHLCQRPREGSCWRGCQRWHGLFRQPHRRCQTDGSLRFATSKEGLAKLFAQGKPSCFAKTVQVSRSNNDLSLIATARLKQRVEMKHDSNCRARRCHEGCGHSRTCLCALASAPSHHCNFEDGPMRRGTVARWRKTRSQVAGFAMQAKVQAEVRAEVEAENKNGAEFLVSAPCLLAFLGGAGGIRTLEAGFAHLLP